VLFDGLMRQREINRMLDEIFDDLEEASLDEAEDVVLALYEEGQRENADYFALLTA
jgi:hypothetical protein